MSGFKLNALRAQLGTVICLAVFFTLNAQAAFDSRLSVAHVSGIYPRVSDGTYLEKGARDAWELGFQSIEIYLHPSICLPRPALPLGIYQTATNEQDSWCDNSTYADGNVNYQLRPKYNSLRKLAELNPHYRAFFKLPFKTVFLTVDPIRYREGAYSIAVSHSRFTAEQLKSTYEEIYDLTRFLLELNPRLERTFILQTTNEMDWQLLGRIDPALVPTKIAVENAIDFWNTAQQAVDDAKRRVSGSATRVYQGCEINLVAKSLRDGLRSAVTDVLPKTRCDLYGYSAYDTVLPQAKGYKEQTLGQALDYIALRAPDSPDFGAANIYLSEFGFREDQFPPAKLEPMTGRTHGRLMVDQMNRALKWGVRYINLWALYDNECSTFNPTTDNLCPGYWMRKPSGALSETYFNLQSAFSR